MSFQVEEKKKYRIYGKEDGDVLDFIVTSIDRPKNAVYFKIVYPICAHEGAVLSSMENRNDIEEIKE